MGFKFSRGVVVLLLASAPACLGFDELTGGTDDDAGASDATTDDASPIDATVDDAAIIVMDAGSDAPVPFNCAEVDATFCDSFDRDAAIAVGAPWTTTDTRAGCTLAVNGKLTTTFDASTGLQDCYLISNQTSTKDGHFTLDFDVSYTADTSSTAYPLLAQLGVGLPAADDGGIQIEFFQLLIDGAGSGRVGMLDYYPDAAAAPTPGQSYVSFTLGNATPFVQPSPACHLTWVIDAITPTTSATSNCGGIISTTVTNGTKPPHGFAGIGQLDFGYANPGVPLPAWSITYDNMVFRAAP